jgi:choline kinase
VKLEKGQIVKIGKEVVLPDEAHGEFIGLAKFTKSAADAMRTAYHRIAKERPAAPFQHAASLEKAYMTDMIQELVDNGSLVQSVDIKGGWMEIDTPQDLERAQRQFVT